MDATTAFLHDLRKCPRYTKTQERSLWKRMKAGDMQARDRLVESVLAYAFQVCLKI